METIFAALVANALVLAALAYLTRSLLGNLLHKDLAEFKSALERKAAQEIDTYRAHLEKDRLRLQISYGGIFEKQAEAILVIYDAVLALETATVEAIHFGGEVVARKQRFNKAWADLRRTHQQKRILLPPMVDDALNSFMDKILKGVLGYMSVEAKDLSRVSEKEFERLSEKQDKAMEIIGNEVPLLQDKLVVEMRRVIGVGASEL